METEHCKSKDSQLRFKTVNYGIETCAADEWKITVQGDASLADMRHGRQLPNIDELLQSEANMSAAPANKLKRFEVIAVVLYTGPMVSCNYESEQLREHTGISGYFRSLLTYGILCIVTFCLCGIAYFTALFHIAMC